ncbi:peroxiredoxin family protein [Flavobacterium sp.]|jgi:peroxiredoxin|uniref:peroxiredoxin family protein n=1 Tax=Flavobacterium sp. TaxID=239 RepID=UPI0037BFCA5A
MKYVLSIIFLGLQLTVFAQEYSFLAASSKKIKEKEYITYLNDNIGKLDSIQKTTKWFLEDGTTFNQKYSDSVFKSKEGYRYSTKLYRDTISNNFSYVLYKRDKAEVRETNRDFNDYIKADEKNRKKLKKSGIDELTLTDIKGEVHSLETLKDKIILIDFWFINCGPCIKEIPDLNKLKAEFEMDEVEWFAVTYDPKEKVERFLERLKFDYTIVPDSKHLTDRFDIRFYPTTLIIDENRKIVYTGKFGTMNGRVNEIREALNKLIKSKKYAVKAGPATQIEED